MLRFPLPLSLPTAPTVVPRSSGNRPAHPPRHPAMNINNLFKRSKSTVAKQPSHDSALPLSASSSNTSSFSSQQAMSGDSSGRRRIGHRDTNDSSRAPQFSGTRSADSPMPRGSTAQPIPSLYTNDHDMYTQNDLESFSFGAARASYTASIIAAAVDPLSRHDGGEDNTGSDTTPRPSVVTNYDERGDPSQLGTSNRRHGDRSGDPNYRAGYASNARPTSQVSHQDLTSDDELHGRHAATSSTSGSRSRSRHIEDETQLYLSEEDVDLDDFYDHSEPEVYAPQASVITVSSRDKTGLNHAGHDQRAGSIAIPGSGARDNYSRRPSKSMDDLRSRNLGPNAAPPASGTPENYSPSMGTSYPGTHSDWLEARKRSMQLDKGLPQRDKDLPPILNQDGNPLAGSSSGSSLELDPTSWMMDFSRNGLVNIDLSDMSDIIQIGPSNGNEPKAYALRKSSMASAAARRQSTVSSNTDIMYKNAHGIWAMTDTRQLWVFTKKSKSSERDSSNHNGGPDSSRQKDKDKVVAKRTKEPWTGMQIGRDEIWQNPSTGRFTVSRRNNTTGQPHAPQQQRVNIYLYLQPQRQGSLTMSSYRLQTTIHRHSRVRAFSIYRTYRKMGVDGAAGGGGGMQVGHRKRNEPIPQKRNQPMILLAPIEVQRNSTSTNTTRRLESHGLLDDADRRPPRDIGRSGRDRDHEKPPGNDKGKGKVAAGSSKEPVSKISHEPSRDSSAGSVANAIAAASSEPFVDLKLASQMALAARRNEGPNEGTSRQHATHRISAYQPDEEEDDEDDDLDSLDGRRKKHTRTPYSEVYGTLPAAAFEQAQQQEASRSLFSWGKPRPTINRPDYQQPYMPPWPVSHPRSNNQKFVVDDLNTSFTDLGLLPPIGEKSSSSASKRRNDYRHSPRHKGKGKQLEDTSIFADIPRDTLFMILPLWPGETESADGERMVYSRPLAVKDRLYLIVLYRLQPSRAALEHSKIKSGDKKRGQTSSEEESNHVLITSPFQMSARVISHHDLQGTGIRIPEQGLSVCGPMEEAEDEMPRTVTGDDYIIIGLCNNREQGIEFLPYGFATLGLAKALPSKGPEEDKAPARDDFDDEVAYLATPIGRAVMEMAFSGSIAVSSFTPNTP